MIKYEAQIPQRCFHNAQNPVKRLLSSSMTSQEPDPDLTMLGHGAENNNIKRLENRGDFINRYNFFAEVIEKTSRFH